MPRYKLYLVGGRVLEIEAKSARVKTNPQAGERLAFRGDQNQVVAEVRLAYLAAYGIGDAILSQEK